MSFEKLLEYGQTGESAIAVWLQSKGFTVLPVYEKVLDTGKGPQLFTPTENLIAPDMLVYKGHRALWVEAKRKTAFSWYRKDRQWVTGIDLCHYLDYLKVDDQSPWPVWLLFLHEGGRAKDSPTDSPSGLFGNTLDKLRCCESHRSDKWGKSGMVYWSSGSLQKLATLEELRSTPHQQQSHVLHRTPCLTEY